MPEMSKNERMAGYVIAAILFLGYFALFMDTVGAQEILPVNAPVVQLKTVKILTAEERSTILINDIWQPPELDHIKVGAAVSRFSKDAPIEPYGWQAFIGQDARGSWMGAGGYEAVAYGGL
jgi:hypothetical protein